MSGQPQGKVTPLALINDEPVVDLGDDRLGLDTYADTIAAAVLGTAGPFTIGVFGEWGHGKTSLLQLAHTMVDAEKRKNVVTVWFNAWQYEKEEHPVVPLAGTIIRALEQRYARTAKGKLKTAGGSLIRALRAVAYGFSATTKANVPASRRWRLVSSPRRWWTAGRSWESTRSILCWTRACTTMRSSFWPR